MCRVSVAVIGRIVSAVDNMRFEVEDTCYSKPARMLSNVVLRLYVLQLMLEIMGTGR
jgi:hypothetical protein